MLLSPSKLFNKKLPVWDIGQIFVFCIYRLKSCARKFYNIFVSKFVDAAGYVVINNDGGVQCLQCGATMKHMRNYKRHLEDKHSDNTNNHYCGYCGKVYGSKNSLSTHMYSYHREQYLSDKGRLDLSSNKSNA